MSFAKCAIYLTNIYVVRKEESLPTWERGLKHTFDLHILCVCVSLPMWERRLSKFAPNVTYAEGDRLW